LLWRTLDYEILAIPKEQSSLTHEAAQYLPLNAAFTGIRSQSTAFSSAIINALRVTPGAENVGGA